MRFLFFTEEVMLWQVMMDSGCLNMGKLTVLVVALTVESTMIFGTFFVNSGYANKLSGLSSNIGFAT